MTRSNASYEVFVCKGSEPLPHQSTTIWERCADCRQSTRHDVLASVREHDRSDDAEILVWNDYEILRCGGCARIQMRLTSANSEDLEPDPNFGLVTAQRVELFPASANYREPIDDYHKLPSPVMEVYLETLRSDSSGMPILTGVGVRAIVESVCKEVGATGANLKAKIDDLVAKGLLVQVQADLLHKTRILGNQSAHEATPLGRRAAAAAIQVVEHLLHTVYILPDLADHL